MGNSNRAKGVQQNVVHIEFLTAKQKLRKDKILHQLKQEEVEDDDVMMIQDYTRSYEVDYRQTMYTTDPDIKFKTILNLITNPSSQTPSDLRMISEFYITKVKSYQLFVENQEFISDDQIFKFGYDPLNVEIVYNPKHWAERWLGHLKNAGNRMTRVLTTLSQMTSFIIPLRSAISTIALFQAAGVGSMLFQNSGSNEQQQNPISGSVMGMVSQASSKLKYIPKPKQIALFSGMILGRGYLLSIVKLTLTVMFPFLTPLLWLLG